MLKEPLKININNEMQLGKKSISQINEIDRKIELRM